jgi:hypothetical protein
VVTVVEAMPFDIVVVRIDIIDAVFCLLNDVALSVVAVVEAMRVHIRVFGFRRRFLFGHCELLCRAGGLVPYIDTVVI